MPGFDRRGPLGHGPLTGRGLGTCRKAVGRVTANRCISWPLFTAVAVTAAVKDIRNPDGLLRHISAFLGRVKRNMLHKYVTAKKEPGQVHGKRSDALMK